MKTLMNLVVVASLSAGVVGCKSPSKTTSDTVDGITTTTSEDAEGNVTTKTTGSTSETVDGVTTTTTFDGNGNTVTTVTGDPKVISETIDGITTITITDVNGNVISKKTSGVSSVTENGITTTTILDGNGNTATIVSGGNSETIDGITTTTTIDGQGNTVTTTSGTIIETVDGITTLTVIDGNGQRTVTTSGTQSETVNGITTITVIDGNGNRVSTSSGTTSETVDGITITTTIDANGNRTINTSGSSSITVDGVTTTTTISDNGKTKVTETTTGDKTTSITVDGITTTTAITNNGDTTVITTTEADSVTRVTVDGVTTTTTVSNGGKTKVTETTTGNKTTISTVDGVTTTTAVTENGDRTVVTTTQEDKTTISTVDGVTKTTTVSDNGNKTVVATTGGDTVTAVTADGVTTTTTVSADGNTTVTEVSDSVITSTVNGVTTTTTVSENGTKTVVITTNESSVIETKVGIFVDSLVQGLNYQTATYSGKTNVNGQFDYIDGETVTFSIGDISFSSSVPSTGIVTPLTVFKTTSTSDLAVLNLARLLQSLDADRDNSNGIAISEATHVLATSFQNLDFDVSSADFDVAIAGLLTNEGITALVSDADAKEHLEQAITEASSGLIANTTTDTTVATDETGNVTTTTTAADGAVTTTITKTDGTTVTTTALPAAVDNVGSAGGVWRGIFTNSSGGGTTFYKVFITPNRQVVMLSDSEASLEIQGSDMLQSTSFVQTSDGISINLQEYVKENDGTAPVDVVMTGNLTPLDNMKGTYTRGAETGTFVFIYDPIYENDEQPFFYTQESVWTVSKAISGATAYSASFYVDESFKVESVAKDGFTFDYIVNEGGVDEEVFLRIPTEEIVLLPEGAVLTGINEPLPTADSEGCNYDGNLDIVDTHYIIYNITLEVTGCDLAGVYTGLATLEERFTIASHPHDHYNFMTFGVSDGTRTINNRLTFRIDQLRI